MSAYRKGFSFGCAQEGCDRKSQYYAFDQREVQAIEERQAKNPYRCNEHLPSWDIGDPEPTGVTVVLDDFADEHDEDSPQWSKVSNGAEWKGYKNGGKVYLDWPELVRRWGPVKAQEES